MSLSNIEILNEYLPNDCRNSLYQAFYIALTAYNGLLREKLELKKSVFFTNIKTRLLTFMLYRQFDEDILSSEFPFRVVTEEVNNFGYMALILQRDNVNISIAKTNKKNSLPNKSRYRIKYCKYNTLHNPQLRFKLEKPRETDIIESPVFFIVGFKVINGKINYINLMLPDIGMNGVIKCIDLTEEFNSWLEDPVTEDNEEYVEKTIAKLKTSAIEQLSIKS